MTPTEVLESRRGGPRRGLHLSQQSPADAAETNGVGTVDSSNLSYVEGLYRSYCQDPQSVSPDWQRYFGELSLATSNGSASPENGLFSKPRVGSSGVLSPAILDASILQERVEQLIRNYRSMGHYAAAIDPLGQPRREVPELEPESVGFTEADLDKTFSTISAGGPNLRTLREILQWLRNTYCRSIGVQFTHIDDFNVRQWLQMRMESTENRVQLTREEQLRILKRLSDAVVFEEFILKKFQGAKSFSLEGAETLIPLLELAIYRAADQGVKEIILGMAHRGRLNVLASIMGKSNQTIFREFADLDPQLHVGRGDVKYHLGFSNDWHSGDGRTVHLSLCFNPSHLEFVNPVVQGRVRAKQDRRGDTRREQVMPILIHGDAAFAGEGVIQETFNLSDIESTRVGGTVHVIVNNQIGFTTGPQQGRSTAYATDVAKMLQIPIFHVNGEDPEAVASVVRLAMDFRKEFHRDVVIDMYCYRLRGHNEQDEPAFTQPLMYRKIHSHTPVPQSYLEHLLKLGEVTREEGENLIALHRQQLESDLEVSKSSEYVHRWDTMQGVWKPYRGGPKASVPDVETGLPVPQLSEILELLTRLPSGFQPHMKIHNGGAVKKPDGLLQKWAAMSRGEAPLDWAAAEALALGSLVLQGHRVRLHGQDCERGTFGHRHAVLHDVETGGTYIPLQHLAADQAPIEIYNSALSEVGCLGFDYGYSLDTPDGLVMWEAQFGDFVNVAQVIIDQFISSAEDKWNRLSGLVMLLPHGFEGAGPEHSSARLERFLTIAADDNIQVCYPTTPANYFHLLRRQVLRPWRKPLVVMTPKWVLRWPAATSPMLDLSIGTFQRVLPDPAQHDRSQVRRILLCSGKIFYELDHCRRKLERDDIAIVRLEELYPLPEEELRQVLSAYPDGTPVFYVQEEPENMGAWRFLRSQWLNSIFGKYPFAGIYRPASASPATGSKESHKYEQKELLAEAFSVAKDAVELPV
ncbi:MAG: 2-oxoglutarate dehydrogenase E1 component [Planctomycetaceae bacterium]|nr:2-oxoglutarate dehydrogenase E1 component [Planctomycetaceae bacterium]